MKLVLSPAKSLDFETALTTAKCTVPQFLDQSERLNKLLKKESAKSLSQLMRISDALGILNYERNQNWEMPFTTHNARPAMFAFNGEAYKGLNGYSIDDDTLETAQDTIRIISGLYGLLKPLDLIQPYRLEMGTKFPVGKNKNLYEFWKTTITNTLNDEMEDGEFLLNVASNEYFKAIDVKALKFPVITAHFKDFKNGEYKMIMTYAKHARGLMARYVVDTNAKTVEDVKGFNYEGYNYSESMSTETEFTFIR